MAGDVRRGCSRASRAPALSSGQVVVLVMLLAGAAVPAQAPAPQPIDGLFAEDWRERNAAARALIAAERIDEAGLVALLRGQASGPLRAGLSIDGSERPGGWVSAIDTSGGKVVDSVLPELVIHAPHYVPGFQVSTRGPAGRLCCFAPPPARGRVPVVDRDLCIPWSTMALAFHVVGSRRWFDARILDAARDRIADGDAQASRSAAVYLLRASLAGNVVEAIGSGDPELRPRFGNAMAQLLARDAGVAERVEAVLATQPEQVLDPLLAAAADLSDDMLASLPSLTRAAARMIVDDPRAHVSPTPAHQQAMHLLSRAEPLPLEELARAFEGTPNRALLALAWVLGPRAKPLLPQLDGFLRAQPPGFVSDSIVWAELALSRMQLSGDEARLAVDVLMHRADGDPARREKLAIAVTLADLRDGIDDEAKRWLVGLVRMKPFDAMQIVTAARSIHALKLSAAVPFEVLRALCGRVRDGVTREVLPLLAAHGEEGATLFREVVGRRPALFLVETARVALELTPDLVSRYLEGDDVELKQACIYAIKHEPEASPVPLARLHALREDRDIYVRQSAAIAWARLAPADVLVAEIRAADPPAPPDLRSLLDAARERRLLAKEAAVLLGKWIADARVGYFVRGWMREVDPELLREQLVGLLQKPDLDRAARVEFIESLLVCEPLTDTEKDLLARMIGAQDFAAGASSGVCYRPSALQHDRVWARALGFQMLAQPDPKVQASGADIVWSHRDA